MLQQIDVQNQRDARQVTIDKVGVKGVRYPILVEDRQNKVQHTVAELDILVELPHSHRGTHMSRFLEVLNKYQEETLISALPDFLTDIKQALNADKAYVTFRFPYFLKKWAPVSKMSSLQCYNCVFEASMGEDFTLIIGVDVPVTSLCPCSKEISEFGAHNQRSEVRIRAMYNDFVWLEELIELAEKHASCEIYPLLKRVDEKHVTERAYQHPAFVEDLVRDIAVSLRSDDRITWFSVESENYESIHSHNAYAIVTEAKGE